jgi:hypothetical protein
MSGAPHGEEARQRRLEPCGPARGLILRDAPSALLRMRDRATQSKQTGLCHPAARSRPSGADSSAPGKSKRAQGMPGDGLTHGPPAKKKQAAVTTGQAGSTGIPCAMVLRLIRALPGVPGLIATVALRDRRERLDLSVGRPGPHDFAVRRLAARLAVRQRPSHLAPNVRGDCANAPL